MIGNGASLTSLPAHRERKTHRPTGI